MAYHFQDQVMRQIALVLSILPVTGEPAAMAHPASPSTKEGELRPLALSHLSEPFRKQIPQPRPSLPLTTALAMP